MKDSTSTRLARFGWQPIGPYRMQRILEQAIVRDSKQLARPNPPLSVEKYVPKSKVQEMFPTRDITKNPPKWERPTAKDKLISMIRKRNRKTGKTYYSRQQILAGSIKSRTKPAQAWLKDLADKFNK